MAERYIMKDLLLFGSARTELFISLSKTAWTIKPVFGFISDTFPIFGQHRRPYIILCGAVGAPSCHALLLCTWHHN